MENIDFIKWLVSYAEGFTWLTVLTIYAPDGEPCRIDSESFKLIYYPLLLQKAIERINRKGDYEISIFKDRVYLNDYAKTFGTPYNFIQYGWTIDKAKEKALRYIWEQEQ